MEKYITKTFKRLDIDNSGALNFDELEVMFNEICTINDLPMSNPEDIQDLLM